MQEKDCIQKFIFVHEDIRGALVHLNESYQTIITQHHYPKAVKQILGEALAACVLLTSSLKFEGDVSLQFQGDSRLPLLLVQCDHTFNLRGFAKFSQEPNIAFEEAFLAGRLVLTIAPENNTQAYQSIVPIQSTSMSDNIMAYFLQSEQIATKVWLAVDEHQASGMLLQMLPTENQDSSARERFWEYAVVMGETVEEQELLQLDNATLLHRLYHETELRLFEAEPVKFRCRCTPQKMQQVLNVLGKQEIESLIQEQGRISVTCDFCNQQYLFDAIDIAMLFHQPKSS